MKKEQDLRQENRSKELTRSESSGGGLQGHNEKEELREKREKEGLQKIDPRAEFQRLNLSDDFLFARVMEDETVLKPLIEKILDIEIKSMQIVQPQYVMDIEPDSRGIRLDIFAEDVKQSRYCIEMQKWNEYNLDKRNRYYHSVMDLDLIAKGENFRNLRDSVLIFICLFDPYRAGLHRYDIRRACFQMPEFEVNDGAYTVILSTRGTEEDVDVELMEFLRYVENSTDEAAEVSDSDLIKRVHEKVRSVKRNRVREAEYMKLQERDQRNREEGFAAGLREGIEAGREEGLREGIEAGREEGLREGIEKGVREGINALILDNLEESVSKERIIEKLMKRFDLEQEAAEEYIAHFTE